MIHIQESWLSMEQPEQKPATLLEPGKYFFEVKQAQAGFSRAGNEMITLILEVGDGKNTNTVYDWLVGTATAYWKIKDFCQATSLSHILKDGGVITDADCVGKKGKCKITIEPGEGEYPDKNVVDAYLASDSFSEAGDDGIPF